MFLFLAPTICSLIEFVQGSRRKMWPSFFQMTRPGSLTVIQRVTTRTWTNTHRDQWWPDFHSQDHKLFKRVQVTHRGESEYEGGGIKRECQQCDSRCLKAVPRIYLFIAVLLLPHQQIITFTHLQQAVQSPLAGPMATLVGGGKLIQTSAQFLTIK